MRHVGGVAAVLVALAGCAPTTMSPLVMRLGPGHPERGVLQAGVRGGPRLSAPLAASDGFDEDTFPGDQDSLSTRQWSMAYDVAWAKPLSEQLSLHLGVQGEIYYPLPLPGYGLYAGVSSYFGSPSLGVAPALVLRGATDFGIDTRGGPGSILGAEASTALTYSPEQRVTLGLVPFIGVHRVLSREARASALYFGGALAVQFPLGSQDVVELSGGFGRAKVSGAPSWNVPIFGARGGF